MSTTDNIYIRNKNDEFLSGIQKVVDIVESSYGPAGANVIVEDLLYPKHIVTNDGKSMVDKIKLASLIENIGANFIKEAGDKADKDSGDGRKTTMILINSILQNANTAKGTPMEIKRSLEECLPLIISNLDAQTKEIFTSEVAPIASVAAEDPKIGQILQEIYEKIGKEGIIELDISNTFETHYEIKEGVRLRNAGYISPYMANSGKDAIYKKPKILITKQKISTLNDIDPLFKVLSDDDIHELVIYCDDIDINVLNALAFTHKSSIFKTLIIKAPTLWKDWFFEDFAKITGATIIDPVAGLTLKDAKPEHLGTCAKLITNKEETLVIGIKDVSDHIADLLAENTDESKLRASWLQTKAAILRLAANSESELSYITKKARDGRNAASLALKGGVVKGAGRALMDCVSVLPKTIGGEILFKALLKPYDVILKSGAEIADDVLDPALVVKNAITNAISIAGIAVTVKTIITLPEQSKESKHDQAF